MKQQLDNGVGKKSFRDYIIVIDKYLVPFFGDMFVKGSSIYVPCDPCPNWHAAKQRDQSKNAKQKPVLGQDTQADQSGDLNR